MARFFLFFGFVVFAFILFETDAFVPHHSPKQVYECSKDIEKTCFPDLGVRVAKVCAVFSSSLKENCEIRDKCCDPGCSDCDIQACYCPPL